MSRVGLEARLRTIREAAKQHDPRAYALHSLSPELKRWHDAWEAECRAIVAERFGDDPSAEYQALLAGEDVCPPMPVPVREALGIQPAIEIPATASLEQIADIWQRCMDGEI